MESIWIIMFFLSILTSGIGFPIRTKSGIKLEPFRMAISHILHDDDSTRGTIESTHFVVVSIDKADKELCLADIETLLGKTKKKTGIYHAEEEDDSAAFDNVTILNWILIGAASGIVTGIIIIVIYTYKKKKDHCCNNLPSDLIECEEEINFKVVLQLVPEEAPNEII